MRSQHAIDIITAILWMLFHLIYVKALPLNKEKGFCVELDNFDHKKGFQINKLVLKFGSQHFCIHENLGYDSISFPTF